MDEAKKCVTCGKKLRSNNTSETCWDCRPNKWGSKTPRAPKVDADDAVLAGIGMKPPPPPAEPDFQKQFFALAEALGLDPMQMLTDFCRGWVEDTRKKALSPRLDISKPETPVSE